LIKANALTTTPDHQTKPDQNSWSKYS